jgi:hypothetical protein
VQAHPVHVQIERTARPRRVHLVLRLVLLIGLGALGASRFSWVVYLALPALAAIVILQKGGEGYRTEVAPRAVPALRWLAGAYAYLWLLTDSFPTTRPGPVDVRIDATATPTASSALLRLLTSIPALILVALLSVVGGLCWLVGAVSILVAEKLPAFIADFLALVLRVQIRFLAYHLSLVDAYPSVSEAPAAHAPAA